MTSVCLALNVRDAETHIARCITSALKFPGVDRALFIDTGCTDNTVGVIRETLNGSIPYTLYQEKWVGHAHNRSLLLEKVRTVMGGDYTLMLDADMELVIEGEVPELTKDEYMLDIRDRGLIYPLPLLTSNRRPFFYAGVAHAYLACADANHDNPVDGQVLNMVALLDHGGGGHRPGKIERDAELLAQEIGKNPGDQRSWFYLAQSYRDLDKVQEAIAAYKIRASLGGWDEEVYQALYQAGSLLCQHVNYYEGAKLLITAAEMKQNRTEALRVLAACSTSVANKIPQPKDEVLFVEPGAYTMKERRAARPEVEEIFFHRYMPKTGDTVVELGAAQGTETGLLSQMVGPEGHVLAVEPHPRAFEMLAEAHGGLPNVKLLQRAVVPANNGPVKITDDPVIWHNHLTDGEGIEVESSTLDMVTRSLKRIDLLKVNIEGSEGDVLAAAPKTLAKTQNVVVSCHDFVGMATKERTRAALETAGFDVQVHDDPTIIVDGHNGRCLGDYLYASRGPRLDQVSAVMVVRGDDGVDLRPTLDVLPFGDIHVWDNSKRENLKTYGRVKILEECANDIVFSVDDDVIFTAFPALLAAYEPGMLVCNMDPGWYEHAGYGDWHHLTGAGSIYDRNIPIEATERYLQRFPMDDEFLTWCDAIVGTLAPGKRVNLGYEVREFSDGPGRLWTTPGNPERKWSIIDRCRAML